MKFNLLAMDIDTSTMDAVDTSNKLLFIINIMEPDLKITKVEYKYDAKADKAHIDFYRDLKYHVEGDMVHHKDAMIITYLPENIFIPKVYGGKNDGMFMPVPYYGGFYCCPKLVIDFWEKKQKSCKMEVIHSDSKLTLVISPKKKKRSKKKQSSKKHK